MRTKLPLFWVKIFYYEYWPFWFFFLPMVPFWLYLAMKARSLTYFTAANPGIEHSGVFGESKIDILKKIDPQFLPKTLHFKASEDWLKVLEAIETHSFTFPIIAKPNVGERGSQVEKIDNEAALRKYMEANPADFLVQEFIDYSLELGVLYYRIPDTEKRGITSIVMKEFLTVTGDGKSSIRQLLLKNERYHLQIRNLEKKLGTKMDEVLPSDQSELLQPIGNHCLGTKFLSGQHLINEQTVEVFHQIASKIEGFNFGRFDLKVSSPEDLLNGKNIKIMELNGVTSEAGHIYDPKFNLFQAYRDVAKTMKVMFEVSQQSRKLGAKVTPAGEMIRLIRSHFSSKPAETKSLNTNLSLPNALDGIQ